MYIENILQEKIIDRKFYLEKVEKFLTSPIVKVLIGQRRVGKSSILKSIIQKLYKKRKISLNNFFYINKELFVFDHIKNYEDLKNEFIKFIKNTEKGRIFVGIDEIQEISGWEKFVNGLLAEYGENIEIFITGSNSFLLSGELATYLTGRYVEFKIFPLNFEEFLQFKNNKKSKQEFLGYLKYGGLPAIFKMEFEDEVIFSYLQGVYNTILLKDIIPHYKIKNIDFFKTLSKYVFANIGNIISGKKIKDYLKSQQINVGVETVLNYLSYLQDAFLINKIYSVNPENKKIFEIYNKYYATDLGLRNSIVGFNLSKDIGKLLENYVYLELVRAGYDVIIGRLSDKTEVDFIAMKNGITKYFQVATSILDENTRKREFSPLEKINDNREKYIVSFDDIDFGVQNGIKWINVMNITEII